MTTTPTGCDVNNKAKSILIGYSTVSGTTGVEYTQTTNFTTLGSNKISFPISVKTGNWYITKFAVYDVENPTATTVAIAFTPNGSASQTLKSAISAGKLLPMPIAVQKDVVSTTTMEVICANGFKPEDFGYPAFKLKEVLMSDFLTQYIPNASNDGWQLTTATVNITDASGNVYYNNTAVQAVTTAYSLPWGTNGSTVYTIAITASNGYAKTFTKTIAELSDYKLSQELGGKGALAVYLDKNLIYTVSTLATGFDNICDVTLGSDGNLYVADAYSHKIKKITLAGVVTDFAGSTQGFANGTGSGAKFNTPHYITSNGGTNLYVTEANDGLRVRGVNITTASVTLVAGSGTRTSTNGIGDKASFENLSGICLDRINNILYVAQYFQASQHTIRAINPSTLQVTTFVGGISGFVDGIGSAAKFKDPQDIVVDVSGNLYVADAGNYRIRKITPAGVVSTFAGNGQSSSQDGVGTNASFVNPTGLAFDKNGNLYVSDNSAIRKIDPFGVVTTIAGTGSVGSADGIGKNASFNWAHGIEFDANGTTLYVADRGNNKLRKITISQ